MCIRHLKDDFSLSKSIPLCIGQKTCPLYFVRLLIAMVLLCGVSFIVTVCVLYGGIFITWNSFGSLTKVSDKMVNEWIRLVSASSAALIFKWQIISIWLFIATLFRTHYFAIRTTVQAFISWKLKVEL